MIKEEFAGFVERIDGDTAYVTLKQIETGEVLWGEYPAEKMLALGIHERRRFKLETTEEGIYLEAIPDKDVDEEKIRRYVEGILS